MCCYNYGYCSGCCHYPNKPSGCGNFVVMILFLASAGTIIGLSAAGYVYSTKLNFTYRKIKCSILLLINEVIEGANEEYSPDSNWKGVTQTVEDIKGSLGNIDKKAMSAVVESKYDFTEDADYSYVTNVLSDIEKEFVATKDSNKVTHPWSGSGKSLELDILYGGKYAEELFGYLKAEIETYEHIYTLMPEVVIAAEELDGGAFDEIDEALDAITDFESEIKELRNEIDDILDLGNTPIKIAQLAMSIYHAVIIGCCSVAILGSIFLILCKCNEWRCISNFACLILAFLMIMGFLLTAVLMPVSVVLIEVCDVIELESLKEDPSIIGEDTWDELKICLDEDYSIASKFNLDEKIESFKDAEEGAAEINEIYDDSDEAKDRECKVKYNHAKKTITELEEVRDKNPEKGAPDAFLSNTFPIRNGECLGDDIVWIEEDCGTKHIVDGTDPPPSSGACFPIIYSKGDCKNRANRYSDCTQFKAKVDRLCDYYNDLKKIIDKLIKQIDRDPTYTSLPGTGTGHFKSAMDRDNHEMRICGLIGDLATSDKGLSGFGQALSELTIYLDEFDCSFVQDNYNRVHIAICESFIQNFASIALFLGIISAITLIFIIFLICVNRRFYVRKKEKKKNKDNDY